MDRKERKAGDPFGGAPMKQFGTPQGQLPAPPDITEEVKPVEAVRNCPQEYLDLRCPCGMKYEDCMGFLFMNRDETFEAMARDRNKT